jgi:hypothetical protein
MPDKKPNNDSQDKSDNKINKKIKKDPESKESKDIQNDPELKSSKSTGKTSGKDMSGEDTPISKTDRKTAKVSIIKKDDKQKGKEESSPVTDEEIENKITTAKKDESTDSNYQVSLVDENTLKIKIKTDKGVSLNSTVGGKNVLPDEVEGILNKLGSGKDGEIEIEISINPEKKSIGTNDAVIEKDNSYIDKKDQLSGLTPNPEVQSIVNKTIPLSEELELTDEEKLREKIGRKSPFNINKRIYAQNFQIGIVGGVIVYLIAIFSFYAYGSKQKIVEPEQQQRLIVLQDLPDPKINLENIEDPNAPPEEETESDETSVPKRIPTIRRNFNSPIKRPQTENSNIDTNTTSDSTGNLADTNVTKDTSTASGNNVPDSLMTGIGENDIGLRINFPREWVMTDEREINKNLKTFSGILLVDTAAGPGGMNIFVHLDDTGEKYRQGDYDAGVFELNDTTITAYHSTPREEASKIKYKFYVYGKEHKLAISAEVDAGKFEKYKPVIESVVRSISFAPKPS